MPMNPLRDTGAVATVAVKDLKAAAAFYEERLGLVPHSREGEEVITYRAGATKLNVYRSEFAGTNEATSVTWVVGDVAVVAKALAALGVVFEHYDLPGMKREGDVHVAGAIKAAWFKDPDGNIHNLASG